MKKQSRTLSKVKTCVSFLNNRCSLTSQENMKYICILLIFCIPALTSVSAQDIPAWRSQVSIMVVPYTSQGSPEQILQAIESNGSYRRAIAFIQEALIAQGYEQLLDFREHMAQVDASIRMTVDFTADNRMKEYIERAPVDIYIETEIEYMDPPDQPRMRQARISLKAIDKYNAAIYAANAAINSYQREFVDIAQAVDKAIRQDGAAEFNKFLRQLDTACKSLHLAGPPIKLKFEVADTSGLSLLERVGSARIADKIKPVIKQLAYKGRYKLMGEHEKLIRYTMRIPPVDEQGNPVLVNDLIRSRVDQQFADLGITYTYSVVGNWIIFILQDRKNKL